MRKALWLLPVFVMAIAAAPALAQFDNSHHDMRRYEGSTQGCYHCHSRVVTTTVPAATRAAAGDVGALCLGRCHAPGVGIYTGTDPGFLTPNAPGYPTDNGTGLVWVTPAPNYTAVTMDTAVGGSHGRVKALAGTNRSGFPYDASGSTGNIECTSCHAVHDDAFSPFIWRSMYTAPANGPTAGGVAPAASALTTGLCDVCHADKANIGGVNLTAVAPTGVGNHPVDFVVDTAAASTRTSPANGTTRSHRHPRLIAIDGPAIYGTNNRVFDVATPAGATLRAAKTTTAGSSWVTGGKMATGPNTYGNFASGSSVMGCYTCHSAHKTTAGGTNNLVGATYGVASQALGFDPLCVGCHGNGSSWANDKLTWNIGMSSFGHPVGDNTNGVAGPTVGGFTTRTYTTTVGGFSFNVAVAGGTIVPAQYGANYEIMCTTCHDVHPTITNYMSIRDLGQGASMAVCKKCHNGVGFPNVNDLSKAGSGGETANAHHRTTTSAVGASGFTTVSYTPANETEALFISAPTWNGATGVPAGLGDLSLGMDCADCHVFNGTAHNW